MEEGRERVGAQRIGFGKHDMRPVRDNAIPDGMHWAYPSYFVHRKFEHRITSKENSNSPLYHLVGTKHPDACEQRRGQTTLSSRAIFLCTKKIAVKPRVA
jgi:hypothetical protein